jgi:hypothetical protein
LEVFPTTLSNRERGERRQQAKRLRERFEALLASARRKADRPGVAERQGQEDRTRYGSHTPVPSSMGGGQG